MSCHLGLLVFAVTAEGSVIEPLFSLDFITESSTRSCKMKKCHTFSVGLSGINDRKQYNTLLATLCFVLSWHAKIHDKRMSEKSENHFPLTS